MKVPGGGREKRRLSFRALDIEQIGHVYEGLLDHTARRATETVLGLDGKEEIEVALSELNRRRAQPDFLDWLGDETGRSAKAIEKALTQTTVEDPQRWPEWEQVVPFAALVRRDDNGDPWVIPAGSLYVTTGNARRQTGTQYTPRTLTEGVVEHALEPQVYTGPAEGQPPEAWLLHPASRILDLKVCDFACGSAAFLVAAARYLSARLVEAWDAAQREHGAGVQITPYGHRSNGLPEEELIPADPDERGIYALRIVVERCLYGVDRNPLAVEMAKLSLWLLTLQRNRPFTFLDHAIRCGDSLLGVNLRQLSTWSLSGEGKQTVLFNDDLSFAADKREGLMKMQYRTGDQRRLLDAALARTHRLRATADRLIATAFEANLEASAAAVSMGLDDQEAEAQRILEGKRPFHWPVEFPEVFLHRDGFDAIVGNPPFMGGLRLSETLGDSYNTFLMSIFRSASKKADLCAYFFLRAYQLGNPHSTAGLLATNTISQGVTRRSSLDRLIDSGCSIYRSIKSFAWPGQAAVIAAMIHFSKRNWEGLRYCDNQPCRQINALLDPDDSALGQPERLLSNTGRCFQGATMWGDEFFLDEVVARQFLSDYPLNEDIVKPAMGGRELNNSAEVVPNRWAINFGEMSRQEAERYQAVFKYVEANLRDKRSTLDSVKYERVVVQWWKYFHSRSDLFDGIRRLNLRRVLARSRVSDLNMMAFVESDIIFTDALVVFLLDSDVHFAILQSTLHDVWVRVYASTLKNDVRYVVSDCFETFPLPMLLSGLGDIGNRYYLRRREVMIARNAGLTRTYNLINSCDCHEPDVEDLRRLQVEMDYAVAAAYGWTDLDLGHGFHETKQGIRYTISEAARRAVLDRLLALNHERYAAEQSAAAAAPRPKAKARKRSPDEADLF
jgi:hypothetical protein